MEIIVEDAIPAIQLRLDIFKMEGIRCNDIGFYGNVDDIPELFKKIAKKLNAIIETQEQKKIILKLNNIFISIECDEKNSFNEYEFAIDIYE